MKNPHRNARRSTSCNGVLKRPAFNSSRKTAAAQAFDSGSRRHERRCRAARTFLDWSQPQLAEASGVGLSTIVGFEHNRRHVSSEAIAELKATLEEAGLEFISDDGGGAGIRFRDRKDGSDGEH